MPLHYYVVIDGKPSGPYLLEELKTLQVSPYTFIKHEELDDYKEAQELEEIRELLDFEHVVTVPQYFASLDQRLLAVAIDYLLLTIIYSIIALVGVWYFTDKRLETIISVSSLILIPLSKIFYATWFEASYWQGTLGKSWLGVKVCDLHGRRISLGKSFIRNLAKILSFASLGVGYLMGFFDKRQRCLHDRIAGTLVIKDRLL
jgi:uncharacterized RDD family membrane protein YckC